MEGGENREGQACPYHIQPLTTAMGSSAHSLPGWDTKQAAGSVDQAQALHIGVTCIASWKTLIQFCWEPPGWAEGPLKALREILFAATSQTTGPGGRDEPVSALQGWRCQG